MARGRGEVLLAVWLSNDRDVKSDAGVEACPKPAVQTDVSFLVGASCVFPGTLRGVIAYISDGIVHFAVDYKIPLCALFQVHVESEPWNILRCYARATIP